MYGITDVCVNPLTNWILCDKSARRKWKRFSFSPTILDDYFRGAREGGGTIMMIIDNG